MYLGKGQSAIEYLMTYGWMLLVVAITGSAIFAIVQNQSIQSISGFDGDDLTIEDFGTTNDSNLQLLIRNSASDNAEINSVNISLGESWTQWSGDKVISVGESQDLVLANVTEGDSANNLDVSINYDSGGLENLSVSGEISGRFEITESGSSTGDTQSLPDPMSSSELVVTEQ
ncbi:MAG: hypothetical protein R6V35_00830 [Candidatus Nanohaloarchaea archaeon]